MPAPTPSPATLSAPLPGASGPAAVAPAHGAFRSVPKTGVIFVTTEASRLGFATDAADWCNLGQGQPETGLLEGGPARITRTGHRCATLCDVRV